MSPPNACLIIKTTSVTDRKRKRAPGTRVSFCMESPTVNETYSALEYDRSGLFPIITQQEKPQFILALSINFVQPSAPSKVVEYRPPFVKKSNQKKKPKLSIDTSDMHGPLYFTNMSTNHQKKSIQPFSPLEGEDGEYDQITRENTQRNRLPVAL